MPVRINVDNTSPQLGREADILVSGYWMQLMSEFVGDFSIQDDSIDVFGSPQIYQRARQGGSLRLTSAFARESQSFMDILCSQMPDSSTTSVWYPNVKTVLDVVKMYKVKNAAGYNAIEIYPGWRPSFNSVGGNPKERKSVTVEGPSQIPTRIVAPSGKYVSAVFETRALTYGGGVATAQLNNAPAMINAPGSPSYGNYAFSVTVQDRAGFANGNKARGAVWKQARVEPTTAVVSSAGLVTIRQSDLIGTGFTPDMFVNVNVLYYLYFANYYDYVQDGLYSAPTSVPSGA